MATRATPPASRMRPQQTARADRPPQAAAITIVVADESDDITSWPHRLRLMLAAGCGTSLVFHALVLVACAFIVLTKYEKQPPQISTRFFETRGEDLAITEIDVESLKPPTVEAANTPSMSEFIPAGMEPAIKSANLGDKTEVGSAIGFRMPGGGKVVTKGSFSAWTVPEDPKPRQDYLIVIQLRLPKKITRYRKEDLSGFLEGDDGYETPIGFYRGRGFAKKFYGRFDNKARQFVIKIPGGAAKVKDIIRVESKVLKEKQVLVIDF